MESRKEPSFDPQIFLAKVGKGRTIIEYRKNHTILTQGEVADALYYIQDGKIKISVVSQQGKEAIIGMLGPADFFGEGCVAGQRIRTTTATVLADCVIVRIEKDAAIQVIHDEPEFSALFLAYILSRNFRIEADLVDQLFNSSEKRLARVLLLLANFGQEGATEKLIPKISQETLAELIGTTRPRVNLFMNKFQKLGFINYDDDGLEVHSSLLNVILHD